MLTLTSACIQLKCAASWWNVVINCLQSSDWVKFKRTRGRTNAHDTSAARWRLFWRISAAASIIMWASVGKCLTSATGCAIVRVQRVEVPTHAPFSCSSENAAECRKLWKAASQKCLKASSKGLESCLSLRLQTVVAFKIIVQLPKWFDLIV